jgi:hypothetical protein
VPTLAFILHSSDFIMPSRVPWMAFAEAFQTQPTSFQEAVFFKGFHHVNRTGGVKATGESQKRTNRQAVEANEKKKKDDPLCSDRLE